MNSVSVSPDGSRILSGGGGHIEEDGRWTAGSDTSIRFWDLRSGEEIRRFPTPGRPGAERGVLARRRVRFLRRRRRARPVVAAPEVTMSFVKVEEEMETIERLLQNL